MLQGPRTEDEMNETPQRYTQRILGYVKGRQSLAVQAATAGRLARLMKGVSMTRLRKRPALDKWSVSEIVAHLADGEIVGGFRMRFILGSPGSPIVAYDQDKWVTSGHYDKRDPRKSLGAVSRGAGSQSCAPQIAQAREVEGLWEAFRTRARIDRGHRAHVCWARSQSLAAN